MARFTWETAARHTELDLICAEEYFQHLKVRAIERKCPDGCSGYGAVRSAIQEGSASVSGLPSSAARGIAFHGRQKSQ